MAEKILDITGVVCPFCVLRVKTSMDEVSQGEKLLVISDHPPAAKDSIPAFAAMNGWNCSVKEAGPGIWELTLQK